MSQSTADPSRRGWREKVEPGVRRAHRLTCASTADLRPGRRCGCPWSITVPGIEVGTTRTVTLDGSLSPAAVARERRRLLAAGRPERQEAPAHEFPDVYSFVTHWLDNQKQTEELRPHTIQSYWTEYRRRIHDTFGHVPLADITRRDIAGWLAAVKGLASDRDYRAAFRVLRRILNVAVAWDLIPDSPARGIRLGKPKVQTSRARNVLDEDEVRRLLDHPKHTLRIQTMLRAAVEAGLRRAEICGLRWTDLDLPNRTIEVRHGYKGASTKNGRSRSFSISAPFAAKLAAWYDESVVHGDAKPDGHVWPGRDAGEMDEHTPTTACARAMVRAGLVGDDGKPLVSLHGLRHTCASWLLAEGIPSMDVAHQLGHGVTVLERTYAHVAKKSQRQSGATVFDRFNAP